MLPARAASQEVGSVDHVILLSNSRESTKGWTGQGYSGKVCVLVPLAVLTMCHTFSGLNQHSYLTVLEVRSVKISLTGLTSRYRQCFFWRL